MDAQEKPPRFRILSDEEQAQAWIDYAKELEQRLKKVRPLGKHVRPNQCNRPR